MASKPLVHDRREGGLDRAVPEARGRGGGRPVRLHGYGTTLAGANPGAVFGELEALFVARGDEVHEGARAGGEASAAQGVQDGGDLGPAGGREGEAGGLGA